MAIRSKAAEAPAPSALPGAKQVEAAPVAAAPAKVDYKEQARQEVMGKVRMNCIVAALQSPAGPAFAPTEEAYLALVTKLADVAFEYTFKGEK